MCEVSSDDMVLNYGVCMITGAVPYKGSRLYLGLLMRISVTCHASEYNQYSL